MERSAVTKAPSWQDKAKPASGDLASAMGSIQYEPEAQARLVGPVLKCQRISRIRAGFPLEYDRPTDRGKLRPREEATMLYFVCLQCDDRYVMDEDFVEVPDDDAASDVGNIATRRVGLDYQGADCLCPICETFSGRLLRIDDE